MSRGWAGQLWVWVWNPTWWQVTPAAAHPPQLSLQLVSTKSQGLPHKEQWKHREVKQVPKDTQLV